jgi:zinc protease
VSAYSIEGIEPGFIAISLTCAPENVDQAVAKVRTELLRLATDGVTSDELSRLQRSLKSMQATHMQRRSAIASAMAFHEAYGLPSGDWNRYDDLVSAVTLADVKSAAHIYLEWDRAVVSVVRPRAASPGAKRRFDTALSVAATKEKKKTKKKKAK